MLNYFIWKKLLNSISCVDKFLPKDFKYLKAARKIQFLHLQVRGEQVNPLKAKMIQFSFLTLHLFPTSKIFYSPLSDPLK